MSNVKLILKINKLINHAITKQNLKDKSPAECFFEARKLVKANKTIKFNKAEKQLFTDLKIASKYSKAKRMYGTQQSKETDLGLMPHDEFISTYEVIKGLKSIKEHKRVY